MFLQAHQSDVEQLPEMLIGAVDLLPDLLQKSRAGSTNRKYECAFIRWKKWALCNGLGSGDTLPVKAFPFAIYLSSLIQTSNSPSPVITAFYAMKWFHDMCDVKSPTDSRLVANVLESAKRILSKPVVKKEPITADILFAMYSRLYSESNLKTQRIICACLVAYAGFMRSAELLQIKLCDIVFSDEYMSIFMESSKTDKYRDGSWIMIAKTGTVLCPVVNLLKYIGWANFCDEDFVFCNISKAKDKYIVRKTNKHMSYSNLRDEFLWALTPHVTDIKRYCLHSLRSGGATAAANGNVRDRLFKRHGRWVSETAKDGYVKDDLRERLSVSLALGL